MDELHVVLGSGTLGRATAEALQQMGKRVRIVNRSGTLANAPDGVELAAGNTYDAANVSALTAGAVSVYQCAQPKYNEWPQKFPAMQSAILQGVAASGAKLVVADNLYMYGHPQGVLHEDSPVVPTSRKGKVRAEMAQQVMEAHRSGKLRVAVGRASNFFGPFDGALTTYAILPAVLGKTVNLIGKTDQPHSFTYVKDFGSLLATLGTREDALGQVWFAPTNPPMTQTQLVGLLQSELGTKVKHMAAGAMMLGFLGMFNKDMAETVEMMYEWNQPFVMDSSKACQAFGLSATPMKTAIAETLAWCKTIAQIGS